MLPPVGVHVQSQAGLYIPLFLCVFQVVSSKLLRELFLVREEIVCLMSSSLDLAEFDPVAARVTVEQYCDRLVMLSMRDQTGCVSDEVTATLGAHKLINKIARIVQRRLEMGPPKVTINQYSTEFTTTFHMKTLFLMNCMNHILEAMLLSFGAQLTTVTLKSRVSFVGSLVDLVTAPFRFCLSLCSRREVPRPGEVSFALTHSIRQRLLADAVAIHSWTAGSWGSFRIPCVSRTDTLLALQLRHASARLYESILYLPDSASGLDLLLNSVKHVLAPGELLKDLTALIQVPSEWYTVYISTRLSLQALLNAPDRTSRLADLQRALHIHCFQPRRCGGGYDVIVSWQLLFGWVGLFTEVLMTMPSPLREEERLQLRGDSELGDADGPPMMTLRLLAELPGGSCVQVKDAVLIRKAASDALELTSLPASEPSSDSVQSRLTAGLSLWTFRPSPHLRVRHMSYRTGSTLLPVPKRAHLVPHSGSSQSQNRVHTESPVAGPSTATAARPASRWRTGLRSPSARILVDDYTGLHNVPLDEPVTLDPTEPNV